MPVGDPSLSIGDVARRAGINTSAIRFYERHGLLPAADRVAGHRRYEASAVRRLEVINVGKQAGLSLAEIRVLLNANDARSPMHGELHELANRKLPEIDALIERARATRSWLLAARACSCDTIDACGLFARGDD